VRNKASFRGFCSLHPSNHPSIKVTRPRRRLSPQPAAAAIRARVLSGAKVLSDVPPRHPPPGPPGTGTAPRCPRPHLLPTPGRVLRRRGRAKARSLSLARATPGGEVSPQSGAGPRVLARRVLADPKPDAVRAGKLLPSREHVGGGRWGQPWGQEGRDWKDQRQGRAIACGDARPWPKEPMECLQRVKTEPSLFPGCSAAMFLTSLCCGAPQVTFSPSSILNPFSLSHEQDPTAGSWR